EVMPGATSPLGIEVLTKYLNNVFRVNAMKKGLGRGTFNIEKYNLIGAIPFMNHMMLKVIDLIAINGFDTQMSKGFMISIFGRILEDPEMMSYGRERFKKLQLPPFIKQMKFYLVCTFL
ncbi:PPDK_N domain-containing protein, partial [Nephila pilipes]